MTDWTTGPLRFVNKPVVDRVAAAEEYRANWGANLTRIDEEHVGLRVWSGEKIVLAKLTMADLLTLRDMIDARLTESGTKAE